jgi:hypothetical protein
VVIPSEAVQVGQEGQHVFIVKEDRRVEVRPVTIGRTAEGEAIIIKGLSAGEQVVREGQFLLGPGSRVEIKDPTKITDETKGERRGRGGRGKGKADGEGQDSAKGSEEMKGEGRRERGGSGRAEGEMKEASKGGEEGKGEGRRGRRGQGKAKPDGEASSKGDSRGAS